MRFNFSVGFIVETCIKMRSQESHMRCYLIFTFLLLRSQSYLFHGSVCDERCLLGRDIDVDLQEVTWQARWLYYACQRWKGVKHAHRLQQDWTWDTLRLLELEICITYQHWLILTTSKPFLEQRQFLHITCLTATPAVSHFWVNLCTCQATLRFLCLAN